MSNDGWETITPKAKSDGWETIVPDKDRSSVKAMLLSAGEQVGNTADRTASMISSQVARLFDENKADSILRSSDARIAKRKQLAQDNPTEGNWERLGAGIAGLPSTLAMGPIAPAVSQAADLSQQGVDPTTANIAGGIIAAANIPQMLGPLAKPIAGTIAAPFIGGGADALTKKYLESKGYGKQAGEIDPTDPVSRTLDVLGAAPFAAHQHLADKVRPNLLKELDAQKYENPNTTDPLTKGASPNVAPWEKTKGQLDLGLGDTLGLKDEQTGLYESGLHPDEYLRRGGVERTVNETGPDTYSQLQNNPQPGQGDLFAGTRPYTPEELPAQQAAGRDAVARAAALEQALEFERQKTEPVRQPVDTGIVDTAGKPIGPYVPQRTEIQKQSDRRWTPQLNELSADWRSLPNAEELARRGPNPTNTLSTPTQIPGIDYRNTGMESGISFTGNAEPGIRNRPVMEPLKDRVVGYNEDGSPIYGNQRLDVQPNAAEIESGRSGKTLENDPHAVEYPSNPTQMWLWPDNEKGKVAPTPHFDPTDNTTRGTWPRGSDKSVAPRKPFEGDHKEGLRGQEPFTGDHKTGDLTPKAPNAKAATPAYSALDKSLENLLTGKEQLPVEEFPGSKNGIVKLGNGGYLDLDLIKIGVSKLIDLTGSRATWDKFKGMFDEAYVRIIERDSQRPESTYFLTWMSPDDYLRLASQRGADYLKHESPGKRETVRGLIASKTKLEDMPTLHVDLRKDRPDGAALEILGHDGRHRVDIFKEMGFDKIPIRIDTRFFKVKDIESLPDRIMTEDDWKSGQTYSGFKFDPVFGKEKSPYDDHIINMANGGFINPEWQKKVTDFVKESIMGKARNTVEGTTEQARFMSLDHRSASEVISKIDPETVQDLGEKSRIAMNVMDTYGAVRVAREFKGSGETIKWYADQSKIIDRSKEFVLENLLKGTEFVKSLRGFEFRKFSDKSPVRLMQTAIKSDWEGTRDMLKTWFEASRDGVEPSFKNPKHKEIYDSWQTVFDYTRNHMNVLRAQNGLPPIPRQTAYFPLMRMGDYRVVASDANGNMQGAWHFNTVWEARAFKKALAGELPTLQITDPAHLKRSKYDYAIGDFTALEAANAALKHNPDILAQVTKAYAEATMRKGFGGKHSIESRHILGAMGLDYSRKGTVDALKAFEMYTERSMDYIAGLQKRQKMAEMLKAIADRKELQGKMDNTLAHLTDMFNFQRDALKDWAKGASEILDFVSRKSGFGEQGTARATREFSGLTTSWFLSTSAFLMSQPVQWVTGLSGLHTANGGGLVGAGLTVKNVFNGLAMTFFPDQLGKEGISYAAKFGSISPETAEMYGARHIMNGDTILQELINNPGKSYLRGFSTVTQALEKHTVRIPYFLMQLDALKGQIKDKNTLFETAAHNTDRYMVDYSKNQQAMIYQRLGNLGSGLRPLKTFSNNLLGQFAEYALEAKHGNVGPMAIMLGTSVLLAGLAGNMVAQTVDDIIRGLNVIWPSANLPTLHETVMEMDSKNALEKKYGKAGKTAKSVAQFGVTSTILGYDVSSSVAQNSLKSFFTIPAAGLPMDMSWELGKYLVKDWQNKATEADKMKAYLALTPPSLKEYMRNQFVKNGAVPNPNAEMKLEYQRGPEEQKANEGFFAMQNLISRPSLNEAKARAINRAASENLREQALDKKSAANVLADAIIENKEVTPEMMQNYIKEGGDPRRIVPMIRMRMMDRIFTEIEQREMKKGVSGAAGREKIQKEIEATHGIQKQSYDGKMPPPEQWKQEMEMPAPKPMRNDGSPYPPVGHIQGSILENMAKPKVLPKERDLPISGYKYQYDPSTEFRIQRIKTMQKVM